MEIEHVYREVAPKLQSYLTGLGADDIATLEGMASADGDYSRIERDCILALAKISL